MNIVFMGTPEFAVPALQMLLREKYSIVAVVTQPDRPKGRKRTLTPPPVKVEAQKHGIPVLQPERMRHPEAVAQISALQPDLIVTAAYGQILPKALLELPRLGCINLHGSLLPKYRGGAPIQHAIIQGETVTGITLMYMAEGLDTGDMLAKTEVPIEDDDNTGTLFNKLSVAAAELLQRTMPELIAGRLRAEPQNDEEATLAPNIKREDERIDWTLPADKIWNLIRGLSPSPGAYTTWNGDVFKIYACKKPGALGHANETPGVVLQVTDEGIEVQTGSGSLWLTQVQPAGKRAMDVKDFRKGAQLSPGTVLGL